MDKENKYNANLFEYGQAKDQIEVVSVSPVKSRTSHRPTGSSEKPIELVKYIGELLQRDPVYIFYLFSLITTHNRTLQLQYQMLFQRLKLVYTADQADLLTPVVSVFEDNDKIKQETAIILDELYEMSSPIAIPANCIYFLQSALFKFYQETGVQKQKYIQVRDEIIHKITEYEGLLDTNMKPLDRDALLKTYSLAIQQNTNFFGTTSTKIVATVNGALMAHGTTIGQVGQMRCQEILTQAKAVIEQVNANTGSTADDLIVKLESMTNAIRDLMDDEDDEETKQAKQDILDGLEDSKASVQKLKSGNDSSQIVSLGGSSIFNRIEGASAAGKLALGSI